MKYNGNGTEHCALPKLMLSALTITTVALLSVSLAVAKTDKISFSDPEITDVVEEELFFDDAVLSNPIDVETSDGIVTLTGATGNILAKERAATLAETVSGVRSVINRIEVKPAAPPTGEDLADAVSEALLADPAADSYEVNATANDRGEVTLAGTVDSWQERQLTESVANKESPDKRTGLSLVPFLLSQILTDFRRRKSHSAWGEPRRVGVYGAKPKVEGHHISA